MESNNLTIYHEFINCLLNNLNNEELCHEEYKKIFTEIVKVQMCNISDIPTKITKILQKCTPALVEKLWLEIVKDCEVLNIIDIFKATMKENEMHVSSRLQHNNDLPMPTHHEATASNNFEADINQTLRGKKNSHFLVCRLFVCILFVCR